MQSAPGLLALAPRARALRTVLAAPGSCTHCANIYRRVGSVTRGDVVVPPRLPRYAGASGDSVTNRVPRSTKSRSLHIGTATDGGPITYVTDCEGNLRHFARYVSLSSVLHWAANSTPVSPRLDLAPGARFVFGGDLFDKGRADERLARCLVDLYDRHPGRVHLIVGNRDNNKMRLTSELDPRDAARHPRDVPGPYWVPEGGRVSFHTYLRAQLSEACTIIGVPPAAHDEDYSDDTYAGVSTPLNKLKYMLKHTMGGTETFEHRRHELAFLQSDGDTLASPASVTDDAVLQSFVSSVDADAPDSDAFVRRYLERAQIAVVLDDTLFVHGAVDRRGCGFLPDDASGDGPGLISGQYVHGRLGARQWVDALIGWYARGRADWLARPRWDEAREGRGGAQVLGYGHGICTGGRTVMVSSFMDGRQHPSTAMLAPVDSDAGADSSSTRIRGAPCDDVVEYLHEGGIRRVVVGHQPFGDSPTIMRHVGRSGHDRSHELTAINADTSFSHVGWGQSAGASDEGMVATIDTHSSDSRGLAVAEVLVQAGRARVHGSLAQGTSFDLAVGDGDGGGNSSSGGGSLAVLWNGGDGDGSSWLSRPPDKYVGLQTPSGWWVKALAAPPHRSVVEHVIGVGAAERGASAPGDYVTGAAQRFLDAAAHARVTPAAEAAAAGDGDADNPPDADQAYLLSQGRGFEVRFRWVSAAALEAEMGLGVEPPPVAQP